MTPFIRSANFAKPSITNAYCFHARVSTVRVDGCNRASTFPVETCQEPIEREVMHRHNRR